MPARPVIPASRLTVLAVAFALAACAGTLQHGTPPADAPDPGVRGGDPAAGGPLTGMASASDPVQKSYYALFASGLAKFAKQDTVAGDGLGPTFNFNSCVGCHAYPAAGGSSPGPTRDNPYVVNPQYQFWSDNLRASNLPPSFIVGTDPAHPGVTPVREARFVHDPDNLAQADGGVHDLFTIVGLPGTPAACTPVLLQQPDFAEAVAGGNVIYRIPTPTFGAGLIEQIPDSEIERNRTAEPAAKKLYGIIGKSNVTVAGRTLTAMGRKVQGTENRNGNDGTIARFGWKAQNKSLLVFSGEAYNVEMGISNELFQTERDETPQCQTLAAPNDHTDPTLGGLDILSDVEKFAAYMRMLAPPAPAPDTPTIVHGRDVFSSTGCNLCHTPMLRTGSAPLPQLANQNVYLYSDLLVHRMGPGLADGISQGQAGPDEFRSAPLWGVGQRTWFLHDGRTNDLVQAIYAHESGYGSRASEANQVVERYRYLPTDDKAALLAFLRAL